MTLFEIRDNLQIREQFLQIHEQSLKYGNNFEIQEQFLNYRKNNPKP